MLINKFYLQDFTIIYKITIENYWRKHNKNGNNIKRN